MTIFKIISGGGGEILGSLESTLREFNSIQLPNIIYGEASGPVIHCSGSHFCLGVRLPGISPSSAFKLQFSFSVSNVKGKGIRKAKPV